MGGVSDEGEGNFFSGGSGSDVVCTEMVFYVASGPGICLIAGELVEDGFYWFTDDVCEDVETATVGHSDGDVFYAMIDGAVDEGFHARDEGFAAFETETFFVWVFACDEFFKGL